MRDYLLITGIACAILGFIVHDLWYVAFPALIVSLMLSPSGRRADGQKKLPGPFGWILDEIVIAIKMKNCPHCGNKVLKTDTICFFCKKEINEEDSENLENVEDSEKTGTEFNENDENTDNKKS